MHIERYLNRDRVKYQTVFTTKSYVVLVTFYHRIHSYKVMIYTNYGISGTAIGTSAISAKDSFKNARVSWNEILFREYMMFRIERNNNISYAESYIMITTNCYDVVFVDRYTNPPSHDQPRYQVSIHFLIASKWEYVYGYSDNSRKDAFKKARADMNALYFGNI